MAANGSRAVSRAAVTPTYQHTLVAPMVSFEPIGAEQLNGCLVAWEHKMGPLNRPGWSEAHALYHAGEPVAVAAASMLMAPNVCGFSRRDAVELSRLCACRPALCRVVLRLWREFVLPTLPYRFAISYQDEALHTGRTYRFDGWRRLAEHQHSGSDTRSGRPGRTKTVWYWDTEWSKRGEQ